MDPDSSPPSPADLQAEIQALRSAIKWLEKAFIDAESLDDRLRISANLALCISHLARLLRILDQIRAGQPHELDLILSRVLEKVNAEWKNE